VISCPYAHPLCGGRIKIKKLNKNNHEKRRRRKRKKQPKINLILSHANHTFLILDLQIETQAFKHTHHTLGKRVFSNVKKGPITFNLF
jgi:hypothetical protein